MNDDPTILNQLQEVGNIDDDNEPVVDNIYREGDNDNKRFETKGWYFNEVFDWKLRGGMKRNTKL